MTLPARVRVVEVGPRDGLQNEAGTIAPEQKVELVERLARAGLGYIEVTSFVSPTAVPQLADAEQVAARIERHPGVTYAALVPNMQGYVRAAERELDEVAVFTAASETFNQRNVRATIAESIDRFAPVVAAARDEGIPVRGYVSCAFGCPYEGPVDPSAVREVVARLDAIGVGDISVGDTIGVGVPADVEPVCAPLIGLVGAERLALHLHDTRGTALVNVWAGLQLGIATYDSSVAGLGGCPFAPGATGNLATEDLVWFLHRCGIETGIDLERLIEVAHWAMRTLGRQPGGHVAATRVWPWRDEG